MRSYGQYSALAKALDLVGDRWTLLIVRELLLSKCGYSQIREGLPGIASNLLAERLRHLEESGVTTRDEQGAYELTEWGRGLSAALLELERWAAPLMFDEGTTGPDAPGDDPADDLGERQGAEWVRGRWLEPLFELMFAGVDPARPEAEIEVRAGENADVTTLKSKNGRVEVRGRISTAPDVVVSGPAQPVLGLMAGAISRDKAPGLGVAILGDFKLVERLRKKDWLDSVAGGDPVRGSTTSRTKRA